MSVSGVRGDWQEDFGFGGIPAEFLAFNTACQGIGFDRNSPEEATRDIAFIEACLLSGRNAGAVTEVLIA